MASIFCEPQTGANLVQEQQQQNASEPGIVIVDLERLIHGVIPRRHVIEVAGRPQSGRRALVLHCIMQRLLEETETRAVYLYTAPNFNYAQRCRDILRVLIGRKRAEGVDWQNQAGESFETDQLALSVLERLSVVHPFNAQQALQALQAEIDEEANGSPRVTIVCLDTVDALLGGEALSVASAEGQYAFCSTFASHRLTSSSFL